jgi:hypothetical protein
VSRPLAVGLHRRRNIHRRNTSPSVACLHLDLLVQRPLNRRTAAAAVAQQQLGVVAAVAEVAEQVGGSGRVAVAHAQKCRVLNQDRFAAGGKGKNRCCKEKSQLKTGIVWSAFVPFME